MEGSDHADKSLLQNISSIWMKLTSQKMRGWIAQWLNQFMGSSMKFSQEKVLEHGHCGEKSGIWIEDMIQGILQLRWDFSKFSKTLAWVKEYRGEWDLRKPRLMKVPEGS